MGKIYEQLNIEERTMIQTQLELGIKPAAIAAGLNRSASTLSRELRRNGWTRPKTPPGLQQHSGHGSQYASHVYQALLKQHGIICSMRRKGNCWDTQFKMPSNVQSNLTRAGIGEAAFALTCRLDTGVPRASPGPLPVT